MSDRDNSMQDAAITGAAVPCTINGREYQFTSLVDRDVVELDEWVRTRIFETAINNIPHGCKDDLRDAIIREATRMASAASFFGPEGSKMVAGIEGVTRVMWQCLRRSHPDLTFVSFRREVQADQGALLRMTIAFQRANGHDPSVKPITLKKARARRRRAG